MYWVAMCATYIGSTSGTVFKIRKIRSPELKGFLVFCKHLNLALAYDNVLVEGWMRYRVVRSDRSAN